MQIKSLTKKLKCYINIVLVKEKKHVQQSNSKFKKSWEERRRRKWLKFRPKAMKATKQRKEVLVSDVVEKALQENQRKRNNIL